MDHSLFALLEFEGKFESLLDVNQFRRRERGDATAEEAFGDGDEHVAVDDTVLRHPVSGSEWDFASDASRRSSDLSDDELIPRGNGRRTSDDQHRACANRLFQIRSPDFAACHCF